LLYEVFQEQIEKSVKPSSSEQPRSFWERQFEIEKDRNFEKQFDQDLPNQHISSDSDTDNGDLKNISEGEYSLLHYACSAGDPDIFIFIKDKCKDLQNFLFDCSANKTQETPLHWAVATNQIEIAKMLIEEMQSYHCIRVLEQRSKSKTSPKKGSFKNTDDKKLDGVDSDFEDEYLYKKMLDLPNVCGHTPFFVAIVKGHLKIAQMLLADSMSSVNSQDTQDDTPLHWAVILDNRSIL